MQKLLLESRTCKELGDNIMKCAGVLNQSQLITQNQQLKEQVMQLFKNNEQPTTLKQIFTLIQHLNWYSHYTKHDIADSLINVLDEDTFLQYKADNTLLDDLSFQSILATINSSTTTTTSIESYVPLKNAVWKYIQAGKLARPLWAHKRPTGLIQQSFCYHQIVNLVKIIEDEYWGNDREVLYSYLDFTFRRLTEEGKVMAFWVPCDTSSLIEEQIEESENNIDDSNNENNSQQQSTRNSWQPPIIDKENNMAAVILVWNTGLLSRHMQEMYCVMIPFDDPVSTSGAKWYLKWFHTSNELTNRKKFESTLGDKFYETIVKTNPPPLPANTSSIIKSTKALNIPLISTSQLPNKANYFTGAHAQLLQFDSDVPIDHEQNNNEHIFEHPDRYPLNYQGLLQDKTSFLQRMKVCINLSAQQASYNPRLAVPFYARIKGEGQLQLMLPINLNMEDCRNVDCVAVLKLVRDELTNKFVYQVRTIFSVPLAYNNARIISPVSEQWLVTGVHHHSVRSNKFSKLATSTETVTATEKATDSTDLYTVQELNETLNYLLLNGAPPKNINKCTTVDDFARLIIRTKNNWKLNYCKHRQTGNITSAHNAKPHLCAFAHSDREKNYWDKVRKSIGVTK
jgi:hypothetical protein